MVVQRDRTRELYQIFDSLKAQQGIGGGSVGAAGPSAAVVAAPPPKAPPSAESQRFSAFAQEFSKELSGVSDTIGNLTQLIQGQNVFDDNAPEIGQLTTIVKTKLQQLHDDLGVLGELREEAAASQRSAFSSKRTQADVHSGTVVDSLRSQLVQTSQSFKQALQGRTRTMKDAAQRRNRFTSDRPSTFESALFQQADQHQDAAQQQSMALQPANTNYFRQRHEAIREVEIAVNQVGEMFQDFTRLVHEQEESIVRIDADVDDAVRYVDDGSSELMRYLANLSSNRGLILKILGVLFFFLLFFGFVVVR